MTISLVEYFSVLEDPRIERNKCPALTDLLVLTVCAVVSVAGGWEAIEQSGKEKLDWLRKYVPLANGVPFHDCITYVLSRLSFKKFRGCFMGWTQAVTEQTDGEVIAIDGKRPARS